MVAGISLDEVRARAAAFVREWETCPGDERQDAQSFVRDLLAVFGVTATRAAFYEKRVKRTTTGRQGYIDALIPGVALIEMKSAGKDLATAERQALDYINGLTPTETPRYILTSDFRRFRLLDLLADDRGGGEVPARSGVDGRGLRPLLNHRNGGADDGGGGGLDTVEFALADLPGNVDRLAFLAGYSTPVTQAEQEAASVQAAKLMASLYSALELDGFDEHDASVFLVRTLFCLYADDAGVWERDLFFQYVHDRTAEDGTDLGSRLAVLYQALARPPEKRSQHHDELVLRFPYVNGDLFDANTSIPVFSKHGRDVLLECCAFNWAAISPAVFGSLFQAVRSKEARRALGEHYTTERNILRLIGPMFLDDLRARFETGRNEAAKLRALLRDLANMRFLDPACGCGNFLVVAYRELRALNLDIVLRLQELQHQGHGGRTSATNYAATLMFDDTDLAITLNQFHGIEIEEWPARIAATALHLADHQANQAMTLALGIGPDTLPLHANDNILVANALRTDWNDVVGPDGYLYIFGNPPFIGQYTKSADQTADMKLVWGSRFDGYLDYVTGWFAKAIDLLSVHDGGGGLVAPAESSSSRTVGGESSPTTPLRPTPRPGEFAFVSTNSITQGQPVSTLFGLIYDAVSVAVRKSPLVAS